LETRNILAKLTHLRSVYGSAASSYLNDPVNGPKMLRELYEQLTNHPEQENEHFGEEVVTEIKSFVQEKIKMGEMEPVRVYPPIVFSTYYEL
jgi:hypothetical protein